jgi:uncharacterized membrane protein
MRATMRPMIRPALIACAAAAVVALTAGAQPAAAATCKLTASEKYNRSAKNGPTYTRNLRVSGGASCATGHKMIRSFYNCRVANGGRKGRCRKKVLGFSCTEKRSNVIATQFDAKVTCKKGSQRILHDYTQLT